MLQSKLTQFLRAGCGYKPSDMVFVPISGLYGTNIKDPVEQKICPWYKGGTLFSVRATEHCLCQGSIAQGTASASSQ